MLVGQNTWKNIDPGKSYFPLLWFYNPAPSDPTVSIQYPTPTANANIYPWDATGSDNLPYATMNLVSREGTTMTFIPVFPTNLTDGPGEVLKAEVDWGDGTAPVQVLPLVQISHTFPASGQYPVTITFDGKICVTVFLTG